METKVIKTHDSVNYIPLFHCPSIGVYRDEETCDSFEVTQEMVRGRCFRNAFGVNVVIGWDEQTQNVLGLPFATFDHMEKRRQGDYETNTRLRKEIRELKGMSFWQFLKRKFEIWIG